MGTDHTDTAALSASNSKTDPQRVRNSMEYPSSDSSPSSLFPRRCVFITVGPPCSGKTTWLLKQQQLQAPKCHEQTTHQHLGIVDVALDNQPGVYEAIQTRNALIAFIVFTSQHKNEHKMMQSQLYASVQFLKNEVVLRKSLWARLQSVEQNELGLVASRLAGWISAEEFAEEMKKLERTSRKEQIESLAQNIRSTIPRSLRSKEEKIADHCTLPLIDVVENILFSFWNTSSGGNAGNGEVTSIKSKSELEIPLWMPKTIDLFVQDRIFRGEDTQRSGLESARFQVEQLLACEDDLVASIAWGNTNTRPKDYRYALQMAASTGRPVYFITHSPSLNESILDVEFEPGVFSLEGDFKELLRRNVARFVKTGRYIPLSVIDSMYKQTESLTHQVILQWKKDHCSINERLSKFEFDRMLCRFAKYNMKDDRTVFPLS